MLELVTPLNKGKHRKNKTVVTRSGGRDLPNAAYLQVTVVDGPEG